MSTYKVVHPAAAQKKLGNRTFRSTRGVALAMAQAGFKENDEVVVRQNGSKKLNNILEGYRRISLGDTGMYHYSRLMVDY